MSVGGYLNTVFAARPEAPARPAVTPSVSLLFVPWCAKSLAALEEFAQLPDTVCGVHLRTVNCFQYPEKAVEHGVQAYPAVVFRNRENKTEHYAGPVSGIVDFIRSNQNVGCGVQNGAGADVQRAR